MKVGFCTGCFDLLHEGHLYFLEQATDACDYLIVAVNSDASVRRLKGTTRPVDNFEERLLNLMARASGVGAFIPFEGDRDRLVMSLRPHVVVMGYDQEPVDQVVYGLRTTAQKAEAHGMDIVPVVRAKHLKGHSTSLQIAEGLSKTNA